MNATVQPAGKITIWPCEVAIWKNERFYNATFSKCYKDGEEYKHTHSFGRDDLLTLAKLADQAHTWILRAEQRDHSEQKE